MQERTIKANKIEKFWQDDYEKKKHREMTQITIVRIKKRTSLPIKQKLQT